MAQTFTSTDVVSTTNVFADNQSQRTNENTLRSTFSGSSQPSDPVVGQQWYDTDNSKTMQYNGTTWVPIDTNGMTQVDVNNAKGSLASLTSYLRVAHNDDGTLKSSPVTAIDEFKDNTLPITYLSPTSFTVPSDLTSIFTTNRKVKVYLSASTAISYVVSSTFNTVTAVTLGSPVLDATVTAVKYSIIQDGMPQDYSLALAESIGYGIVSGCTPSINGLTVTVASGVIHLADGMRKEISTSTVTLDGANSTNGRIDLVYITSTGAVAKVTGTASATPSMPALPANGISVATVSVAANGSTVAIADMRGMLARWYNAGVVNVKDFGAVGDGVTDDTAALQTAINSGKKIILDGVFRITAPLNINNAINIQGTIPIKETVVSRTTSRILVDLTADGSGIVIDVVSGAKVAIRDLSIVKKTNNTHTINAMEFKQNTSDSIFENIVIGYSTDLGYGFEKGIVFADTCWSLCFTQISIYNCNAIGIEANNLVGTVFNRMDIFSTPIGIKSTNSSIIINQGDFDKCHIGMDAYGGNICMRNVGAENYEASDGGLEKAYIRSDGTAIAYIDNPSFYNNGYDIYNLVSISNGTWDKPIVIDNYHYIGTNRFGLNVASSCKQGCVKFVNFTTGASLPSGFNSPYVCMNGEYSPRYMPDSSYFPGSLTCTLAGPFVKHYKGHVDYPIGNIVLFSTAWTIEGTVRHISSSGVETVGVIDGVCYPTPSSFSAVRSESNKTLTISATSGRFDIDIMIRSGYATPSDYPVY